MSLKLVMAKTPPSRSSSRGSKPSSKPSSKSSLKSGKSSSKGRLIRPPGWYVDRAKKSQAIKAALEAKRVIRQPVSSDSSSDSDTSFDHHANDDVNVDPGVGGVDLEVDPSSPSSPPPPHSVPQNGLDAISSGSSSDEEDEDEDTDRALSNEGSNAGDEEPQDDVGDQDRDSHEGDEGPRGNVVDRDVDQRPVGLAGTPGHAGQGGKAQSTPLNLQTRPPSLDISPTEITQDLNTHSG